jgi:hypothetical protein
MSNGNGLLAVCGLMCIYPLLFFALPAYILGRYRVRLRSPIQISDPEKPPATGYAKRQQSTMPKTGGG